MECLSAEVAPCLFKSTILSCMEYCCYVWAGTPSCYLDMLDKLNYKRLSRTVGPKLGASLELLGYRNLASIFFFSVVINFW